MSYDPCGSQKLEGEEIIKRIAKALNVDPKELAAVFALSVQRGKL